LQWDINRQKAKLSLWIADRTANRGVTCQFGVTWRHRSRDHLIVHMPFPIGGHLEPSLYL